MKRRLNARRAGWRDFTELRSRRGLRATQVKAGRYFAELVKMTEHGDSTRAELK